MAYSSATPPPKDRDKWHRDVEAPLESDSESDSGNDSDDDDRRGKGKRKGSRKSKVRRCGVTSS